MARVQASGGMSAKEAAAFQVSIRRGLRDSAEQRYRKKLADIDAEIARQRTACAGDLRKLVDAHDAAVSAERVALSQARADKKRAEEARKKAAERLAAERAKEKGARTAKRTECKVEADGLKAKRVAEKVHHDELRAIERSTEKRKRPLSTAGERREEERDAVEGDIPAEYVPLWRRVRQSFAVPKRSEGRTTLREAFIQHAEENPDQVLGAQEEDAARELSRMQREQGGKRRQSATTRREALPPAPF